MASARQNPLDRILRDVQSGESSTGESFRFTPALDKLNRDQSEWLSTWIQEGYQSRRELIIAVNQMQFWSLGRVPDGWFAKVCSNPVLLSILVTSERRHTWREDPLDLDTAKQERRMLAAKYVRPAFRAAFRELRKDAKQYTNEEERLSSVDGQSFFAMRPALDELYEFQTSHLLDLLNGFETMDHVDEWLARLDEGTLGELAKVEPDFDWKIYQSRAAQDVLTGSEGKYERERELWAAVYLLPAYNRAVGVLTHHADEHREDEERERMQAKQL